ncbi:MAG: helix-turn-helix domain-containing protein [Lachnospiraceae bacterium]|nr:helix-turn-helix domain-containing protein [Lachnospiraceae bacterium]
MDQIKVGKFIAELRHRDGLTQEALGAKIGVTNKTVSRWENGNYMPDIEMLQMLGDIFHVSINELLAGCYLNDEEFKTEADKNIVNIIKDSAFSYKEKFTFWKRKWLKEHIALIILWAVIFIIFCLYVYVKKYVVITSLTPLIGLGIYAYLRNKMMAYIERNIYG